MFIFYQCFYLDISVLDAPQKRTETMAKFFSAIHISSRDGPVESSETRQELNHTRRLPYKTVVEKKDKKTTLHLLHIHVCAAGVG